MTQDQQNQLNAIAQNVKQLREAKRLTPKELGQRAGFHVSDISRIENARLALGEVRARRLARALRIPWRTLVLEDTPTSTPPPAAARQSPETQATGGCSSHT